MTQSYAQLSRLVFCHTVSARRRALVLPSPSPAAAPTAVRSNAIHTASTAATAIHATGATGRRGLSAQSNACGSVRPPALASTATRTASATESSMANASGRMFCSGGRDTVRARPCPMLAQRNAPMLNTTMTPMASDRGLHSQIALQSPQGLQLSMRLASAGPGLPASPFARQLSTSAAAHTATSPGSPLNAFKQDASSPSSSKVSAPSADELNPLATVKRGLLDPPEHPSSSSNDDGSMMSTASLAAGSDAAPNEMAHPANWKPIKEVGLLDLPALYLSLSKAKLASQVVLTAMVGYAMAPGALSIPTLFWASAGTALCVACANTVNQWIEVPFDAQMSRTKTRVLVRGQLSPFHAMAFGVGSGITGVASLYAFVSPITAGLGLLNIFLYTLVYTPMKRTSIANTWAGAVVGAIPPVMGWTACTGSLDAGALLLAYVMFVWQFPHFNALSWNLRGDYSRAGYRMMAVTDPQLTKRVTMRYALAMLPVSFVAPMLDMTTWTFAADSLICNGYMTYLAWRFYSNTNDVTARRCFLGSVICLPILLTLFMVHKKHDDEAEEEDHHAQGESAAATAA